MLFVKVDELKAGMRLGKPIYNRNGVLLYDRDSKLTMQAIYGIRNFGLMGLYILEPAEPVPPMSEDDINFERFQTMAVFSIREDLDLIASGKKDKGLDWLCSLIMKNYATLDHKINFIQSLRSTEDFVYKHSLSVAIITAIICGQLGMNNGRINMLVKSAILHDIGALKLPIVPAGEEQGEGAKELIRRNTLEILNRQRDLDSDISMQVKRVQELVIQGEDYTASESATSDIGAAIIYVADSYDAMTAMKSYTEPTSEVKAIRELLAKPDLYDAKVVNALIGAINILYPGVCVEFTNHDKGLVIIENKENLFRPWVLSFTNNKLYDLSSDEIYKDFQIADIMKTMDNRIKLDPDILQQYQVV